MGIRMLHRRTAQTRIAAQADTAAVPSVPPSPVRAVEADASTARIPADLATTVRTAVADLGRRLGSPLQGRGRALPWRQWPDLARGYLALLLTLLPKPRPPRTITVFVATVNERPDGSAARPVRREPRAAGPDPTP